MLQSIHNIIDNDLMNRELNKKSVVVQDNPFARGSYHTTSYKQLGITSSCNSSNCLIVIALSPFSSTSFFPVIASLF